jgi:tRNA(fMet)-specific endonuclease VapC
VSFLLDTDTCIYWLKGNKKIERKAVSAGLNTLHVSFISLSELYYGVYKSQRVQENLDGIKTLEGKIKRVDSDQQICETFGKLKAILGTQGKPLDDADLFIASCALANDLVLVTNNEKHFKRVKGLKWENWTR